MPSERAVRTIALIAVRQYRIAAPASTTTGSTTVSTSPVTVISP